MNQQFDQLTRNQPKSPRNGMALSKRGLSFACMALAVFGLTNQASADPTYEAIDFPGTAFTLAAGINSGGEVVGRYIDALGLDHGFLLSGGTFTSLDIPGAGMTRPIGINDQGDIVGHYNLAGQNRNHGFLLRSGVFTTIDVPGAESTVVVGINNNGEIAGYYKDAKDRWHGFVLRSGVVTTIDYPRAKYTEAWRINASGQIAGRYAGSDGNFHLYRLSNGQFESFDVPGAVQTAPSDYSHVGGLNNSGDMVNAYASDTPFHNLGNPNVFGNVHGVLLSGGAFTSIDAPGAVETLAFDINDGGQIVGVYADATGVHGFLRKP